MTSITSIQRRIFLLASLCFLSLGSELASAQLNVCKPLWEGQPVLVSSNPATNATIASNLSQLTAVFSVTRNSQTYSLNPASVNSSSVQLMVQTTVRDPRVPIVKWITMLIPVSGQVSLNGNTIIFKPNAPLAAGASYVWRFTDIAGVAGCYKTSLDIPFTVVATDMCGNPAVPGTGSQSIYPGQSFTFTRGRAYDIQVNAPQNSVIQIGGSYNHYVFGDYPPARQDLSFGYLNYSFTDVLGTDAGLTIVARNVHWSCTTNQWIAASVESDARDPSNSVLKTFPALQNVVVSTTNSALFTTATWETSNGSYLTSTPWEASQFQTLIVWRPAQ